MPEFDYPKAKEIVSELLTEDTCILVDRTITKDYGWVFFIQTKRYAESGEFEDMIIGTGGILIESDSGRMVKFGSAYSTERSLEIYEKGYLKYENNDLIIHKVNKLEKLIELLNEFRITYVIPEEECGVLWKIPQYFSNDNFIEKLKTLPCRFNVGKLYFSSEASR